MAYTTITTEEEKKKKQQAAATNGTNLTTKTTTAVTPKTATKSTNQYASYEYDPNTNQAYLNAMAALKQVEQNKPTYTATYDDQLKKLYDQIVNRERFAYDPAADPLWQNHIDQYTTKGKMAMMDTMGQAAALTGGYGSSYGQQVGQQTYQGYLQEADQALPEFYGMALDAYIREGDAMNQQYAMLGDLQEAEYGRYQDALDRYWQDVSYQQQLADDAYDQGYENWYNAYQMGIDAENTAYNRKQDSYEKLVSLITSTGYSPSAAELEAAGMSSAQAKSYANYYKENKKPTTTSSSSSKSKSSSGSPKNTSSSSGSPKETTTPTTTETTKTQKPYTYGYYVGWDAGDWEGYFAKIRQKEGKAAAQEELNYFTSHGLIPKSKVVYAASGVRGGQTGH